MRMRSIPTVLHIGLILLPLLVTSGCRRGARENDSGPIVGDPSYRSRKPLFCKIALPAADMKILTVAFDESRGTGKGYDVLYADADLSGSLTNAWRLCAETQKLSGTRVFSFPPIPAGQARDSDPIGNQAPCTAKFTGYKSGKSHAFFVTANLTLSRESTPWQYTLRGGIQPAETLAQAPVLRLDDPPRLEIDSRVDLRKNGQMGIEVRLMIDEARVSAKKRRIPITADVQVTNGDGEVVHKVTDRLDKFFFG